VPGKKRCDERNADAAADVTHEVKQAAAHTDLLGREIAERNGRERDEYEAE
jgi:hypothetical protein